MHPLIFFTDHAFLKAEYNEAATTEENFKYSLKLKTTFSAAKPLNI